MKNNNNFKQRPHPKLYVDKEPGYVEKLKDFHIKQPLQGGIFYVFKIVEKLCGKCGNTLN